MRGRNIKGGRGGGREIVDIVGIVCWRHSSKNK
jgi:hypothetical protein